MQLVGEAHEGERAVFVSPRILLFIVELKGKAQIAVNKKTHLGRNKETKSQVVL
jgi:hypothetical protein